MHEQSTLVDDTERHRLLAEAHRLIQFAQGARTPTGGFGWLDDVGQVMDRPLELYINCRMSHVFSIAEALHLPESRHYLEYGIESINSLFLDRVHGGWFHTVDAAGAAVENRKTAYDHAFVVLAASSGAARGTSGAGQLLGEALHVFTDHFWDEREGLVRESFGADWSDSEPYRGVNSNMHTVEAFLAASDVTGDDVWRQRALGIADRVVGWARNNAWRIPEHFDENWEPELSFNREQPADPFRPYGATVGHGMEWARLCLHLHAALPPPSTGWLVEAAQALYARAKLDGWARDGADGFVYTVDWEGNPVISERMHWVAAEATAAAAALHRVTGDSTYASDFRSWWTYIRRYLVDVAHGSWHHELSRTNQPSAIVWQGKPDVYHALQACLIPLLPLQPSVALAATTL